MHSDLKKSYSKAQFEEIKDLVRQLEKADSDKQKGIRSKLRKKGFYWEDLTINETEYTVKNLEMLVKNKVITIKDNE